VGGSIVLTNGELVIGRNLRITGPGATNLSVSAGGLSRVFEIPQNTTVNISGLTICDGRAADGAFGTSNSPAGGDGNDGGGIYNAGLLTLSQCVVSNCSAGNGGGGYVQHDDEPAATNWIGGLGGRGGAIYNGGKLLLRNSQLISNASGRGGNAGSARPYGAAANSGGGGGAVYNAGRMSLMGCAFEHNVTGGGGDAGAYLILEYLIGDNPGGSGGNGGAVCDDGAAVTLISDCEFNFNANGAGGRSNVKGLSLALFGSTGGSGGAGGAVWAAVPIQIAGCTFAGNQSGGGGLGGDGVTNGAAGGVGGPGGAICAMNELRMQNCYCVSNYTGNGGDGGGGYIGQAGSGGNGGLGGAVYAAGDSRFDGCQFSGNSAGGGGQGASITDSIYSTYHDHFPGGGGSGGSGGAVYCESKLRATDCSFDRNRAGNAKGPGAGGFDYSSSGQRSTSGSPGGEGGAIFGAGPVDLRACTISGNVGGNGSAADYIPGAQISSKAVAEDPIDAKAQPKIITYSRWGGPGGGGGTGGIYSRNSLSLVLCTLSGNIGGVGGNGGESYGGYMQYFTGAGGAPGGVGAVVCESSNELNLVACTIAGNRGGLGGGGGGGDRDYSGHSGQGAGGVGGVGGIFNSNATVINSILAANFGGAGGQGGPFSYSAPSNGAPDVQGIFTSLGHNLIGQADGSSGFANGVNGDIAGSGNGAIDPVLGPLADNGGPAFTMALLHGSPALDAGDDAMLRQPYRLKTDERGFARKSGPQVDIGAFEFQYQNGGANSTAQQVVVSGTMGGSDGLDTKVSNSLAPVPAATGFHLRFSNESPGATFSVLATSDLSVPVDSWSVIGQAAEVAAGIFEFNDADATNCPQRFYRVSAP
jgi:hypothetical protein